MGVTASVVGITAGVNSLTGGSITNALGFGGGSSTAGGGSFSSPSGAQTAADPFAPYRGNLAAMYAGSLQPGVKNDITAMPGYSQFQSGVMDPALEASKRSGAASGMLRSGNEQIALEKQAQTGYYGFMTDYLNRLATGSGAGYAPSQGANLGATTAAANQQAVMQGLGGIATGMAGLSSSGALGSGGISGYVNSMYGRDVIQADTGAAADAGTAYYGSTYDPAAGWSM